MKHFYIFKQTKNLCAFEVEDVRQGFFYLGEFENENQAYKKIETMIENLIVSNAKLRIKLNIPEPLLERDIFNNKIIGWTFVYLMEVNSELEWMFRQKKLS